MGRPRSPQVSNSAADRAGRTVRDFIRSEATRADAVAAVQTIRDYREMHAYPMARVTMGVRSMVRTATQNEAIRPGQRFKRMDRILDKLLRYHRMRLSQMEDIGGCRVVLPSLDLLSAVVRRIMFQWGETASVTDYIEQPKEDGYRGIHIIERRDGRLIEVQLRTSGQHRWAESVEDWGPRLGFNLKDGEGTDDLREYFKQAAERIAREERGEPSVASREAEFARLRVRVLPYFEQRLR